jgi:putative heme-binding domain-containing protein
MRVPAILLMLAAAMCSLADSEPTVKKKHADSPGPLPTAEAIKRMTVPDGFAVELVAAEPDLVNPVAMAFDERGRIWVTESFEYPRMSAGPGRDRVKVLESTKGDGRYDKVTIFADGLNIPTGIAVGHGGIWVANAPDILFYKEGPDGKAAGEPEVIVTGFGREDVHELPNSLTWGPDGWLYGLNGCFNNSHIKHQGKEFKFSCALFRIHPKTREFQIFAEGTSNPWGLAFDPEGSAFVSACVIDHLWHLVETGYYIRQAGPYPPHTWPIGSIVKHKHQKAAYAGLCYFDSDSYPAEYRDRLYMGNIHGGCINVDVLERDGSTYKATPAPDFLTANDPWFMPVAQKIGPDGCLYILDWYDRYHCYHDAQRDPPGVDRLRGRLYRVRYKDTPPAGRFDLTRETDDQLIQRLHSPNIFFRDLAQRLLCERMTDAIRDKLQALVLDEKAAFKTRMHGLWALVGAGPLPPGFHLRLLDDPDSRFRAWGVRAAGNMGRVDDKIRGKIESRANFESPDVQLQVAIAARKIDGMSVISVLADRLVCCADDELVAAIVWQNVHGLLEQDYRHFIRCLKVERIGQYAFVGVAPFLKRMIIRLAHAPHVDPSILGNLCAKLLEHEHHAVCGTCMDALSDSVHSGQLRGARLKSLADSMAATIRRGKERGPFQSAAILEAMLTGNSSDIVRGTFFDDRHEPTVNRLRALEAMITARDPELLGLVATQLEFVRPDKTFINQMLGRLGRLDDPRLADVVLLHYDKLAREQRVAAVELLTHRAVWSKSLLQTITANQIPATALNVNHIRKLLAHKDAELTRQVHAIWGTVREERSPEREKLIGEMRGFLSQTRGDAVAGKAVFTTACASCHKLHGDGEDVGPDITANGRSDFEQLLSNVFDPSLVIGSAYQAVTVATKKGQIVTGLLVEDNAHRVVLKQQGAQLTALSRDDVEEVTISKVSLMPEGVEQQLKPQEIADLFAFLTLEHPPGQGPDRVITGTPPALHGKK